MSPKYRQLLLPAVALMGLTAGAFAQSEPVPFKKPATALPDRMEPVTERFRKDTAGVGITEHLGGKIPLNLDFVDSTGRAVKLSEYFQQGKPVILQMGYFNCPQLCDKVSEELMEGVKNLNLELGKDYSMLYVSVNPNERWELGQKKKRTYVEEFGKPGAQSGWNFLVTKDPQAIQSLADAVGFNFKKVEGREEYSHPPMITILTADGTISRYLYGFQFPSETLKTGITEAAQGKVGGYVEQVLVALCYHYDEYSGKYSFRYMQLMQAAGVLTMLVVFGILGSKWIKEAWAAKNPPVPHA